MSSGRKISSESSGNYNKLINNEKKREKFLEEKLKFYREKLHNLTNMRRTLSVNNPVLRMDNPEIKKTKYKILSIKRILEHSRENVETLIKHNETVRKLRRRSTISSGGKKKKRTIRRKNSKRKPSKDMQLHSQYTFY